MQASTEGYITVTKYYKYLAIRFLQHVIKLQIPINNLQKMKQEHVPAPGQGSKFHFTGNPMLKYKRVLEGTSQQYRYLPSTTVTNAKLVPYQGHRADQA